jgi:hypothetical protein
LTETFHVCTAADHRNLDSLWDIQTAAFIEALQSLILASLALQRALGREIFDDSCDIADSDTLKGSIDFRSADFLRNNYWASPFELLLPAHESSQAVVWC